MSRLPALLNVDARPSRRRPNAANAGDCARAACHRRRRQPTRSAAIDKKVEMRKKTGSLASAPLPIVVVLNLPASRLRTSCCRGRRASDESDVYRHRRVSAFTRLVLTDDNAQFALAVRSLDEFALSERMSCRVLPLLVKCAIENH